MKIILLITILTLQLFATNPKVYSALGDKLYNNADNIQSLTKHKNFINEKDKIEEYVVVVKVLKGIGFNIDNGDFSVTKEEYLAKLRKLAKTNDYYVMRVKRLFLNSLDKEDSELFLNMIKTGLVNTQRYKSDIKKYYYNHKDAIDINGTIIEEFVAEDESKKKKQKPKYKGPTKEEVQKANIERIRAKDREKQEAIAKSLEEELKMKKEKIREDQKKELKTK
jgi:hypothetical protein